MRRALVWLLSAAACAPEPLPPLAETGISVDTDLPVPRVIGRLRIDLYTAEGRWFDSRDIGLPDARDWPVSFSVYSEDEEKARRVWVRLRVYPEGRVRDYLGERFGDDGAPPAPAAEGPRLIVDGRDRTPATEPEPRVTVDRLMLVPLEPGVVAHARAVLHAACAGTMAFLSEDGTPRAGRAASCVDSEKTRAPVAIAVLGEPLPGPSLQESFARSCREPAPEGRVCVPGGAGLLGSAELSIFPDLPPVPERIAVHAPFYVDRHEVTVARFRQALAEGFRPAEMPQAHEADLGTTLETTCSWSTRDRGRESYALSCVSWQTARELCRFYGGDLPSEAQWEHLATLARPRGRSRYPWGDEPPSCEQAVHGRYPLGTPGVCQHLGIGPLPVDAAPADATPQGVIGAAGGVDEWVLDDYQDYASACWAASSVFARGCFAESANNRALRGGSWASPPTILPSAVRLGADSGGDAPFIGFRCTYPAEPAQEGL